MKHARKKFLAMFIAATVFLGVVPNVFASNGFTLSVTPSKTSANVGDEITYTIGISNATDSNFSSFGFDIIIPEGLEFKSGSGSISQNFSSTTGISTANFDEGIDLKVSGYGGDGYNGGNVAIATFVCTAKKTGNMKITLEEIELYDADVNEISATFDFATLSVIENITTVSASITAPTTGDQPVKKLDTDKFTGTIAWSGNPTTFDPLTEYTATVTLVPKEGYGFSTSNVSVKVNGKLDGKVTSKAFNKLVFTVTFPKTTNKINVSDKITFKGGTVDYNGKPQTLPKATITDENEGDFTYTYVGVGATVYELSSTAPTDAGTYEVTATYNSSLTTGSKKAEMIISKVLPTASEVATTPTIPIALEYNRKEQGVSATPAGGVNGLGAITLTYNNSASMPVAVGIYEVKADFEEGDNYKATKGVVLGNLEITKKPITGLDKTIYVKEGLALEYNQLITDLFATEAIEYTSASAIVVSDTKDILKKKSITEDLNLVLDIEDYGVSDDEAIIKLTYDNPSYDISDSTIKVVVTDKEILSPVKFDIKDKTYDGKAVEIIDEAGLFVNIITNKEESDLEPYYIWSTTTPAINAGNHFVEVTTTTTTTGSAVAVNSVINTKYLHFTIEKAPINLVADDITTKVDSIMPTLTFTVDGLVAPDTWATIKAVEPILTTKDTTAIGTYPITIDGGTLNKKAGNNYFIESYKAGTLTVEGKPTVDGGGNGGGKPFVPTDNSNDSIGSGDFNSSNVETVITPPAVVSNIIPANSASKIIKKAIDDGKSPEINLVTKDGVDFYGSDINSIIDNNLDLIIKKGKVSVTVPTNALAEYNAKDSSKVRFLMKSAEDSFISNTLLNKLKSVDKINEKLLKDIYYTEISVDGRKVSGKQPQSVVTFDISSLNLSEEQISMLTGVYYDGSSEPYIQLGGEISKDGKIFTFHMPYNGNFGLLISDNLVKLKLTINSPTYVLNGQTLTNDVSPVIENDRTILPLRVISEALGADVDWVESTRTVIIAKESQRIEVQVDKPLPNGLGTAKIINDRTFVPVRYVAEELDANVVWNANTREVSIYR